MRKARGRHNVQGTGMLLVLSYLDRITSLLHQTSTPQACVFILVIAFLCFMFISNKVPSSQAKPNYVKEQREKEKPRHKQENQTDFLESKKRSVLLVRTVGCRIQPVATG